MAEQTGIAWARSTFSPWIGCTEVSPGCDHCYARELDKRHRWGGATHWGAGVPRYRTKDWSKPLAWNKKAAATGERWTVFPSLCDPFDNEVPERWRVDFWRLVYDTPHLTWLILSKRIGNAMDMLPLGFFREGAASNVWLGASVVNQDEADRDIRKLLAVPTAKWFVSYEPALSMVDWSAWMPHEYSEQPPGGAPCKTCGVFTNGLHHPYAKSGISQIIIGGESSQGSAKARPFDIAWARSTIRQCKAAGVACFVKQCGSNPVDRLSPIAEAALDSFAGRKPGRLERIAFKNRAGADPAEWPTDLRIQEFPA